VPKDGSVDSGGDQGTEDLGKHVGAEWGANGNKEKLKSTALPSQIDFCLWQLRKAERKGNLGFVGSKWEDHPTSEQVWIKGNYTTAEGNSHQGL